MKFKNDKIDQLLVDPVVNSITVGFIANIGISYALYEQLPDMLSIFIAYVAIALIAHTIKKYFNQINIVNVGLLGTISFAAYNFSIIFFKLTNTTLIIKDELMSAAVFGLMCAAAFYFIFDRRK